MIIRSGLIIIMFIYSNLSIAQNVGVGTNNPDASAALEISDSSKGLLVPRMTLAQKAAIVSPAQGLLVYQTDSTKGFWYYDMGQWNKISTGNNTSTTDPGVWSSATGAIYYNDGKVGVGTSSPSARFHVADSNVIFSGPSSVPATTSFNPPVSGAGTRLMWYPEKAAFRTGYVAGNNWNKDSIGRYSFASGNNSKAKGEYTFTSGFQTAAIGDGSTALGYQSQANGLYALSAGSTTNANGLAAFTSGIGSTASGIASMSIGLTTIASGNYSMSFGNNTTASGQNATSMGASTIASGLNAVSAGNGASATGSNTFSMGLGTVASSFSSVAFGRYNDNISSSNQTAWADADPLFMIGNGTTNVARSNALMVLKNGNIGVGTSAPTQKLHVNGSVLATAYNVVSDRRFKKNFLSIDRPIERLEKLSGLYFEYKPACETGTEFPTGRQVGFIAQEVEEVMPEAVTTNASGYKSVDYSKVVPLLVEGIKAQQKEIREQNKRLENLEQQLAEIKKLLEVKK